MGKVKYFYNEKTLQYEKLEKPLKTKLFRLFGLFSAVVVTSIIFSSVIFRFFPTPAQKAMETELHRMEFKYGQMTEKLDLMDKALSNIHDRDESIHRVVFGVDPMDENVWNGGIGGADHYKDETNYFNSSQVIKENGAKMRKLARQITLESKMLDTIQKLALDREEMLASIPSIKPVREDKIKRKIRNLSGFGRRRHPIHKVMRMHAGIDFPAKTGTPIQATGTGTIKKVINSRRGYGKHVVIDHGHGYQTLYGHMSVIAVKVGQKVIKGQIIGKVGNTGTSTGEHLHYEVRYNNRPINPIDFILDGLTPKEYQDLVNASTATNQSFD